MTNTFIQRIPLIDLCRGSAIALMFIYHFCFDLDYFGYVQFDFNHHLFWLSFRAVIVSLFLSMVGFSLYLAHARGWRRKPYLKRLGLLLGAAALVSLSSYSMYPKSWIFFGILHFIAVASVLGLLFLRLAYLNLVLGVAIIVITFNYEHPIFNQAAMQWLGLGTETPFTEDYVPLFPWFGVVLIGLFLAWWLQQWSNPPAWLYWHSSHPVVTTLRFAGRHSLIIYLLHQPLLLGLLYVITQVLK